MQRVNRPSCPFYGFNYLGRVFMDTKGNQCALIMGRQSPCRMEVSGKIPNWYRCPLFRENVLESFKSEKIFPSEKIPEGVKDWTGIRFSDWTAYVLHGVPLPVDI